MKVYAQGEHKRGSTIPFAQELQILFRNDHMDRQLETWSFNHPSVTALSYMKKITYEVCLMCAWRETKWANVKVPACE